MAWVQANNFGVGFITHDDWNLNQFRGYPDNLWEVTGDETAGLAWITRVGGTQKTALEAQAIQDAWNANIYSFTEFWVDKLSANAMTAIMTIALSDNNVREIVTRWLSESIDVREQQYKDDLAYLLANGHIQQAKHDSMLLNKDGV